MEPKPKRSWKGKGSSAGSGASKKPRVAAGEEAVAAEMSDVYRSGAFIQGLALRWRNKEMMKKDDGGGTVLYNAPYQLCVLPEFIASMASGTEDCLLQLREELSRLKFMEKNNDLYQFRQSDDLKWFKTPCITAFRGVLQEQVLPWLQQVTGIELKSQIDITCSKYEFTDYLLCHDDQLEGRRIAFIFYLAQDWTAQDGGNLELFDTDETGQPSEVVVSIPPVWNNFIFFEVTPASFHQVSEVLHSMKTRLSISGWFHGPQVPRPQPQPFPPPSMTPPLPADLGVLWEWVSPIYLDIGTQTQIQSQFEEESQIQLPNFLLESKYEELCKELQGNQCKWIVKGPPNKRHLHVAEEGSLPPSTAGLPQLLSCEPFCRLLSHLTGLDLAKDVIRLDTVREGDDGGPCCSSAIPRDCSNGQAAGAEVPLKSERVAGTDRVPLNGATTSENQCTEDGGDESSRERVAEVGGEMLNLRPGDYTLLSDQDPSIGEAQLHLLLHLSCEHTDWSGDCGGMRVYVARDGDEELLSVCPSGNALSLVFCDQDTVSFTKYINHRTKLSGSSLFCAAFTYKETL